MYYLHYAIHSPVLPVRVNSYPAIDKPVIPSISGGEQCEGLRNTRDGQHVGDSSSMGLPTSITILP